MNLAIHLHIHFNSRANPNCQVKFNGRLLDDLIGIQEKNIVLNYEDLLLQDINFLHITHYGKHPRVTEVVDNTIVSDVAIELDSIKIDGIKVADSYLWAQSFFPNWSHPPHPKEPIMQNRYMGFNGTWQLIFPKNYKDFMVSHYVQNKFS